jgi:two-component system, NarL family, nitrate/nitrite response regulator NarL
MDQFSVFLIDPDRLFRTGLRLLLEEGAYTIAGEARSVEEAADELARAGRLDLLILDVPHWGAAGLGEFFRAARARGVKLVMLTSDRSRAAIDGAMTASVDAYLSKDVSPDALRRSLQLVMLGQRILPAWLLTSLLQEEAAPLSEAPPDRIRSLTRREMQILRQLISGLSNKGIARELEISEATVKVHVKALLRKVGVRSRIQAAIWARNNGIEEPAGGSAPAAA